MNENLLHKAPENDNTFRHWCIVELFGHSKIAGFCTQENIFGTNMLRVDVPETDTQPAFTKYFGSAAIYAVNPVDLFTAVTCAKSLNLGQVQSWNAEQFITKFNEQKSLPCSVENDNDNDNDNEDADPTGRFEY